LLVQLGQLSQRVDRFSKLDEKIESTKLVEGARWKAVTVWALYEMELATVAMVLLTVPASEAAVERTFSAQDSIHTKKRNRLHDNTVQASMFIAFNTRAMNASSNVIHVPQEVELALDFMDTDTESEDSSSSDEEEQKGGEIPQGRHEMILEEVSDDNIPPRGDSEELCRTFSEIAAGTREFLERYITENEINLKTRWTSDRVNALEAAATKRNSGGTNMMNLRAQIRAILANASL
jgi:hypothetical protein